MSTNALHLDIPAGVPWVDFTREFDAPVSAVFEAHRDPDTVRRWLGPRGYEMVIDRWDFTTGGGYRYVHRDPEGAEYGFRGVFHTIRENEFALQTFEFDGAPDQVSLEFMWFEDLGDGRTRLRGRSIGRSVEGRDLMVESGMEQGMAEGYERLDDILGS
ncbi:MAG: SRPBCC family protein [Ornithinibacter sp.]